MDKNVEVTYRDHEDKVVKRKFRDCGVEYQGSILKIHVSQSVTVVFRANEWIDVRYMAEDE